jgi:hypothetical protein
MVSVFVPSKRNLTGFDGKEIRLHSINKRIGGFVCGNLFRSGGVCIN